MENTNPIPDSPPPPRPAPRRLHKLGGKARALLAAAWQRLDLKAADAWISALFSLLLRVAGLFLLAFFVLVAWRIVNARGYVIAPISAPEALEKSGYTGHVVALHLQDAIKQVKEEAQTVKTDELILQDGEQETLDVSVMGVQVSVKSIAYHLGQMLGKRQRQISGEIIRSGDRLRFTMRFTDFPTAHLESAIHQDDLAAAMDELLRLAALKLLEYNDPYRLALIHYNNKKHDEALKVIRSIIADRPHERAWAYIAWGNSLQEQGQAEAAADKFRLAIQQDSANWLPYYRLSGLAFLAGKYDEAISWMEDVVRLNPGHVDALHTLGWRYLKEGRGADADTAFHRAVLASRHTKYHAAAWQSWIESKLSSNDETAALAIVQMAITAAEENADGYLIRGYGYIVQKDTAAAYEALERAYQLDPTNFRAMVSYAMANYAVGQYEQVVAVEEAGLSPDFSNEGAANLLNISAMASNSLGRHGQALDKINRAIRMAPYMSQLYTTLAEYHAYGGQDEDFYAQLEIAFAKGFQPQHLQWDKEPYLRYREDPRTAALLAKVGKGVGLETE
jgi:tetratricopeptide (TPR) repeat protein